MAGILKEVLLDIGEIERGHLRVMLDEIVRDGANRLRSGKIPDKRYDEILHLHVAHDPVSGFAGKVTPVVSGFIGGGHQLLVGRRAAATSEAADRVIQIRAGLHEDVVDVFDAVEVFLR